MDLEFFDKIWREHKPDQAGMVDFWNRRAPSFNARKSDAGSLEYRRILKNELTSRAHLDSGSWVLDIGCGSGHYSLMFAQHAGRVIGFDSAPRMIEHARSNAAGEGCANVDFEVMDWERVDLAEKGWEKRFQLVLASRTPAVNNLETLTKMIAASAGYCCLISHVETANSIRDHIRPLVDIDEGEARASRTSYCVFNLLWLMGHYPEVTYHDRQWENDIELEDALLIHLRYFESIGNVSRAQREAIADKLSSLAVDGKLRDKVSAKVAVILWRVSPER